MKCCACLKAKSSAISIAEDATCVVAEIFRTHLSWVLLKVGDSVCTDCWTQVSTFHQFYMDIKVTHETLMAAKDSVKKDSAAAGDLGDDKIKIENVWHVNNEEAIENMEPENIFCEPLKDACNTTADWDNTAFNISGYKIVSNTTDLTLDDDNLIDIISSKPALWNVQDKNYKNRTIRPALWCEVLKELNVENTPQNLQKVKKKWDNLRTGYLRYKNSQRSGSVATASRPLKLDKLKFLEDILIARSTPSIIFTDTDEDSAPSEQVQSKRRCSCSEDTTTSKKKIAILEKEENSATTNSVDWHFVNTLLEEMSELPAETKEHLKEEILTMVREAKSQCRKQN